MSGDSCGPNQRFTIHEIREMSRRASIERPARILQMEIDNVYRAIIRAAQEGKTSVDFNVKLDDRVLDHFTQEGYSVRFGKDITISWEKS